jgi:H+/Cl- antiporter ClcA
MEASGLGTYSLALPDVPPFAQPDLAQFGWALVIGLVAAVVGTGIRRLALALRPHVERRLLVATPLVGVAVGTLAIVYAQASGHNFSEVLFSGQNALGPLISNGASYSVGALVLLVACKGLAYGASLAGFRGGPVFPAMFLGAAGGITLSHLPGCRWSPGWPWASGRCRWRPFRSIARGRCPMPRTTGRGHSPAGGRPLGLPPPPGPPR